MSEHLKPAHFFLRHHFLVFIYSFRQTQFYLLHNLNFIVIFSLILNDLILNPQTNCWQYETLTGLSLLRLLRDGSVLISLYLSQLEILIVKLVLRHIGKWFTLARILNFCFSQALLTDLKFTSIYRNFRGLRFVLIFKPIEVWRRTLDFLGLTILSIESVHGVFKTRIIFFLVSNIQEWALHLIWCLHILILKLNWIVISINLNV